MCSLSLSPTVPVRKKGITSVLLSSFANKDNSKVERVTFDTVSRANGASSEFYIGKVTPFHTNSLIYILLLIRELCLEF